MIKFLRRCCKSKRECITYIVIFLWVAVGILASYFDTNFTDLAAYFISLTGFVASYIFGESIRKSKKTSIFSLGTNSRRESMMYITILLWLIVGTWVIIKNNDLMGASAYFAALTPFVGSYIIGETYKSEDTSINSDNRQQINS
jgi:positive regulator of sigma E activity